MGESGMGILGIEPPGTDGTDRDGPGAVLGGSGSAGPIGTDDAVPMQVSRIIARVTTDWDPPSPRSTPAIVLRGKTLEKIADELNALPEWGEGGGSLRTDRIPVGTSTNLTVNLHGNLVYRLPRWANYGSASVAAKAEWDRMFAKLRAHEDRHLAIAIEEGNQLARDLIGHDIDDIPSMVTAANARMHARQQELDNDTEHGAKAGVLYGDVILDISIE